MELLSRSDVLTIHLLSANVKAVHGYLTPNQSVYVTYALHETNAQAFKGWYV